MDTRLRNIANALAETAIDSYNRRGTFMYLAGIVDNTVRVVYNELLIGVHNKTSEFKLAENIAKVAILAYHRATGVADTYKCQNIESETLFKRSALATHATLQKMIKQTNFQRRLQLAY